MQIENIKLKVLDEAKKISQNGWRTVRFGDVVRNVDSSVKNPLEQGIERFVGLEHLDPESLHVKRWGNVADGTSFTRKFVSGQVLFGKRRAYQRKAAVADFDGICSGDILVFEPKTDELLPELLPFVVQSDGFFEHALGTSAGSLSPRTKWSDMARYEFALPPKDEQRRIAEILWAANSTISNFEKVLSETLFLKRITLTELTTKLTQNSYLEPTAIGELPTSWRVLPVGEVLSLCQYGLSISADENGEYPMFRMMNIEEGVILENDLKYINLPQRDFENYHLKAGDILFNRTNSPDLVGKVGIYRLKGNHVFASYLIRLRADEQIILPEYLNYYLNSDLGQARILVHATAGVSQSNINATNLKKVLVPVPPIEEQLKIIEKLSAIDSAKIEIRNKLAHLQKVKKYLISSFIQKVN
jgi:restriction endonuclease S subunit